MNAAVSAPRTEAVFPPGPRWLTPLPLARSLQGDILGSVGELLAQYGDAVGVRAGPVKMVVLARPEYARHVFIRNASNYSKGAQIEKLRRIAGDGVFFAEGEAWRRQRRMITPAFARAKIEALAPQLVAGADAMLERWQREHAGGGWFDAMPDTSRVALDVVCRAMFGADVGAQADEFHPRAAFAASYAQYLFEHFVPMPLWVPTARNRRMREARRWVNGFVNGMIAGHRRRAVPQQDLLGLLLSVRDEETGAALSDRELYDELMTFVNAGHETTAVALAWSLYAIGRDPALRARLEAEIDAQLGDRPEMDGSPGRRGIRPTCVALPAPYQEVRLGRAPCWGGAAAPVLSRPSRVGLLSAAAPDFAALARLDLLGRTIREVLRVFPPGWAIPRGALADDEIDGVLIPRGATVMVPVYYLHRHPEFWSDPERFDPDRWLPERGEPRHQFAYLPFGLGGRRCVGEDFALLEIRAVLARTLQRFRVSIDPNHPVVPKPLLTLKPANGVRIRIETRSPTRDGRPGDPSILGSDS